MNRMSLSVLSLTMLLQFMAPGLLQAETCSSENFKVIINKEEVSKHRLFSILGYLSSYNQIRVRQIIDVQDTLNISVAFDPKFFETKLPQDELDKRYSDMMTELNLFRSVEILCDSAQ